MDKGQLAAYIRMVIPMQPEVLSNITAEFEELTLFKNDYLLRAGKVSNEYFYLEQGYMRAFALDMDGNEITTNFYSPQKVVFEVSSLFTRTPSAENIQALTDCKGYALSFENLNKLFHTLPEFREFGRAMLVKEFVAYKQRSLAMLNQSAEERYSHLMANNPDIFQYAQLKLIASYLGVTDTSLSRIRKDIASK